MTLPVSGAISMSEVNVELGKSSNATISLNDSAVRTLFGISSGAIDLNSGHGKSNAFSFTVSSNQTNANLASLATAAGWNGSTRLVATIASGVIISSNSTGTPALTVSGSFPNGVSLTNNGVIVGCGGVGGSGAGGTTGVATAGSAGGGALSVSAYITIANNGTIGGGGGGGGGGARSYGDNAIGEGGLYSYAGGGGGGGGRSSYAANASGGGGGSSTGYNPISNGASGGTGTYSGAGSGGSGGSAGSAPTRYGGAGGAGGGWGSAGSSGSYGGADSTTPGAGGAGGYAVSGNGYVTWTAYGSRYGSIA